ncbi:MAG TPA: hypothetical protein VK875_01630 [Euzebyales bacterium]|nr:hypothetical protein [Euzebyales bacterium]
MQNAYEAHDPEGAGWRGQVEGQPHDRGVAPPDPRHPEQPPHDRYPAGGPPAAPGPRPEVPRADGPPAAPGPRPVVPPGAADERPPRRRGAPREGAVEIERTVAPGARLRAAGQRVWSTVRRSVPLRTLLFVLPPLVLPPLAFGLSLGATVMVALTLLWLAAAAGVFATMMMEGGEHVALRAIERRLEDIAAAGRAGGPGPASPAGDESLQEALMAIGAQLDALDDRVAALGRPAEGPDRDPVRVLSHRPQEHWPDAARDEQYDRYGRTAVPDRNWGESRWRR